MYLSHCSLIWWTHFWAEPNSSPGLTVNIFWCYHCIGLAIGRHGSKRTEKPYKKYSSADKNDSCVCNNKNSSIKFLSSEREIWDDLLEAIFLVNIIPYSVSREACISSEFLRVTQQVYILHSRRWLICKLKQIANEWKLSLMTYRFDNKMCTKGIV